MSEGCCADDTHHRRGLGPINGELSVPQRYAIDFYKLDEQHRTWIGDPSTLESFLTYRVPILTAAAGTVVAALDGFANTTALALEPTGTLPFTAATPTSPRTNELPLDRDVVQFGP